MARLELQEPQPVKTKVSVCSTSVTAFSHHWLVSYPKNTIRTSIGSWKFFTLRFFVTWIFSVKRDPSGWSMIYQRWRVVHHGTAPFPIHAPVSKGRTHCFVILDGCCTLHRRCCTLWISILRRAITLGSFRFTGAITSQNEALGEFYSYDSFQPSMVSFIRKKSYPNHNRVMEFLGMKVTSDC